MFCNLNSLELSSVDRTDITPPVRTFRLVRLPTLFRPFWYVFLGRLIHSIDFQSQQTDNSVPATSDVFSTPPPIHTLGLPETPPQASENSLPVAATPNQAQVPLIPSNLPSSSPAPEWDVAPHASKGKGIAAPSEVVDDATPSEIAVVTAPSEGDSYTSVATSSTISSSADTPPRWYYGEPPQRISAR